MLIARSISIATCSRAASLFVNPTAALLLCTRTGFRSTYTLRNAARHPVSGAVRVEPLMWSTDSEAELARITERLHAYDPATYTYTENGGTFVEGCKPDHGRVIVATPVRDCFPGRGSQPGFAGANA